MAFDNPKFGIVGLEASGDLSTLQHRAMIINGSGQAAGATAGTDVIVGVLQNKPEAAGEPANVATAGVSKVTAGAAVTAGAKVMSDATGRAIDWTTGNHAFGVALQAAGGAGELIAVALLPIGLD